MSFDGVTGHCIEATFGDSAVNTWAARVISLSEFSETVEPVIDNDICNPVERVLPGDLVAIAEQTLVVIWDPTAAPLSATKTTLTLEWPQRDESSSSGATLAGGIVITGLQIGEAATNERIQATMTFRWNGRNLDDSAYGPVLTPET